MILLLYYHDGSRTYSSPYSIIHIYHMLRLPPSSCTISRQIFKGFSVQLVRMQIALGDVACGASSCALVAYLLVRSLHAIATAFCVASCCCDRPSCNKRSQASQARSVASDRQEEASGSSKDFLGIYISGAVDRGKRSS